MTTRKKAKKRKTPWVLMILILLVLILGSGIVYTTWGVKAVEAGDDANIYVNIPEGSGTREIASTLEEAGLLRSPTAFRLYSRWKGQDGKYQAGTYAFSRSMGAAEMMDKMVAGDTSGTSITLIDGLSLDKVADQLSEAGLVEREEFFHEVECGDFDYPFMSELPEGSNRLEGFLGPDTYFFATNATAHDILDQMLTDYDNTLRAEGIYDQVEQLDKNLYTVITEASVVQREVGVTTDMPLVASVIENRLAAGMPLQMDSILNYIQKEEKIRSTYSDIAVESDYNPYTNLGLPPGPICTPSLDAIRAALSPADTDYLFFVAAPELDGTTRFSETYEEFLVDKEAFDEAYERYIQEHPGEK